MDTTGGTILRSLRRLLAATAKPGKGSVPPSSYRVLPDITKRQWRRFAGRLKSKP